MKAVSGCWRSVVLTLVLASPSLAVDSFMWESDLEAAKLTAARTGRLVLVHFSAPWCVPCQRLEQDVLSQPGFGAELTPYYVGVKLNYDDFPATRRQYGVQSIPTDIVIAADGKLIEKLSCPQTAQEYTAGLVRVAQAVRSPAQGPTIAGVAPAQSSAAPLRRRRRPRRRNAMRTTEVSNPRSLAPCRTRTREMSATGPAGPGAASAAPIAGAPQANTFATNASQPPLQQQPGGPPAIAPGNAPLALDGMCPVRLCEKHVWNPGDVRFGMQHRGRTYLFAGPEELERFRANPDRYSPVMSGNDPVLALDQGQAVAGSRMFGLFCGDHYYLFNSEQTLQAFAQNPKRYLAEAQQARR